MKKEFIYCDMCKHEGAEEKKLQVIFTTEQTEGRSTKPYLALEKLDICSECFDVVLKGNAIFAQGAQGYNTFKFKKIPF